MFSLKDVDKALEFIRVAKRDFEASKMLLESEFYPQGLFLLQQSIEKTAKSILIALGLADIETLRREIGHEILVKGLKEIGVNAIDILKNVSTEILLSYLRAFSQLFCSCKDSLQYFEEIMKQVSEKSMLIQEWFDNKYGDIQKITRKLGNIALREMNNDVIEDLNRLFDRIAVFIIEPFDFIRETGVDETFKSYWNFVESIQKCAKERIKDRNSLAKINVTIKNFKSMLVDNVVRISFLFDMYISLLAFHALFEANVSRFRYPSEKWTPLSISENTVAVIEAKRIIKFINEQKLLDIIEDFITGTMRTNKSKHIYKALTNLLMTLIET